MKRIHLLVLGSLLIVCALAAAFLFWNPPAPPQKTAGEPTTAAKPVAVTSPGEPSVSSPGQPFAPSSQPASPPPPKAETQSVAPAPASSSPAAVSSPAKKDYQPGSSKFKNATDPQARMALSGVGSDHTAEMRWVAAINDPQTPAKERQDLIEDLNEDGISDPGHPAPRDLPVIENRLQLIEQLLPTAMDQVNADAFREARKDLLKMRDTLKVK